MCKFRQHDDGTSSSASERTCHKKDSREHATGARPAIALGSFHAHPLSCHSFLHHITDHNKFITNMVQKRFESIHSISKNLYPTHETCRRLHITLWDLSRHFFIGNSNHQYIKRALGRGRKEACI